MTLELGHFGGFDVAYRSGTTDVNVLNHSFDKDIFFTGVPEYCVQENHVIIDIGAHIGTFSLLASSKVPRGKVYAVEACKESANLCRVNAALNRINNLVVTHLALSARHGTCVLHYAEGNWGHSIVTPARHLGETVPTNTLASFIEMNHIDGCDFLKMNCEGAEFPILLSSSVETLRRIQVMLVLYHCDLYKECNQNALITHLRTSGFATTIRHRSRRRGWIIAKQI